MEHDIKDITLYVPSTKDALPFCACHPKTKPGYTRQANGKVVTHKVTRKEMKRLWK